MPPRKNIEPGVYQRITHTFEPIFNEDSRILILGSLPSVKSREGQFYYHHPQNRFWKILAALLEEPLPGSIDEKKQMLLNHHIAIWDVIQSCDIIGSSDSSIRNVIPADLSEILNQASIQKIYTNGGKASQLYKKYCFPLTHMESIVLPSSSPANAAYSLDKLIHLWGKEILPQIASQSLRQ